MPEDKLMEKIKEFALKIDSYLKTNLKGDSKNLWDGAKHYIQAGGKRLRPFIVAESFKMFNKEISKIIPVASAIEMIHTFSLIHDDIMDKDDIRRGVPSVHAKWGIPIAILSGDLLLSIAFKFIAQSDFPPDKINEVNSILSSTSAELCEGQAFDIEFESREDVTVQQYMNMANLKTAALFRTSAIIGGIMGGASAEQIENLGEFGRNIGIAFQIIDDILGIIATDIKFGKPIGSDIKANKKTYITIYAKSKLDKSEKNRLNQILLNDNANQDEITEAITLIKKSGAINNAKVEAENYIKASISSLESFPNTSEKQNLLDIALLTIKRTY